MADFEIEDVTLYEGQKLQWFSKEDFRNLPEEKIAFGFKPLILDFFKERPFEKLAA